VLIDRFSGDAAFLGDSAQDECVAGLVGFGRYYEIYWDPLLRLGYGGGGVG
jgi:hypothetical protein